MSDEYQPRTRERLIEILRGQGESLGPRSWQAEAAALLSPAPRTPPEGWQMVLKACVDLLEDATNGARYDNETKAIAQARAMLAASPTPPVDITLTGRT